MLRFAQVDQILKVMRNKERIRNVGIIAHIDHGKTTLTDLLLAEAGLIPYSLAGEVRVLDYLDEEQRRGITIKAANISLLHKIEGKEYVVNLIDTPGHVDFTGRVTGALRVIDGAIVLVDSVEEIMAQTEVVTRQALNERVKPVLFINKVDRLVSELKLTSEETRAKLSRIIKEFNSLIELYGEPPFKDEWKIGASKGNIVFGSALHKWGLTFKTSREKGVKFSDIIKAYKSGDWFGLQEIIPLHKAILEVVVKELPNPVEAQKYRIPKIWKGDLNSEVGTAMVECNPKGPTVICVTSVKRDRKNGLIATGRIFSGEVKDGDKVYLLGAKKEGTVGQVSIFMGAFKEATGWLDSGNIAGLSGFDFISAGETIIDVAHKDHMTPFERISYVSEPVITVSIEPKDPGNLQRLINALNLLLIEDPNLAVTINRETGEYLISGIGELHLDIAIKSLREYEPDLEVIVSRPRVAYRESVSKSGDSFTVSSPNRRNQISIRVEPLEEKLLEMLEKMNKSDTLLSNIAGSIKNARQVLDIEENGNILIDSTDEDFVKEDLDAIIGGFRWACRSGPLCGEPIRGIKVNLIAAQLSDELAQRGYVQIMPAVRKAIFGSFLTASPILLEPVYSIQVSAPSEQIGGIINLMSKRRGKVSSISQRGLLVVIDGFIPVAESLGLADELRSVSSGRAFWQSRFSHWERIPETYMLKTIYSVRLSKGLAAEISGIENFID
ncbi:MAG: GTP-binding protein [Candidatus Bathyarchaeia archaeon]